MIDVKKLKIKSEIVVGDVKIIPLDPNTYDNELVKFDDDSVAFRYTDKRTGVAIDKPNIYKDAKLIWQKAQQQQ